jgi:endonuclease/exonuclease/phosphatase family metal-dependent hydrolase
VVLLLALLPRTGSAQEEVPHLKVMTFNIRYGTADDGANAWDHRRDLVAQIIQKESPDILAIQEGLAFQLQELAPVLADYRKLGQHRDGGLEGEFSGLYVREGSIRILDWGEMWLSPTPDVVASVGWDAALTRMAVWVEVEMAATEERVRVYGTHFDHRGVEARRESARLLVRHAEDGPPSVIMGDMNAEEGSGELSPFFQNGYRSAFTALHPDSDQGTFNGFSDPTGGGRIDHILVGPGLIPLKAAIITEGGPDVWPSDHFPVTAVIGSGSLRGNLFPSPPWSG